MKPLNLLLLAAVFLAAALPASAEVPRMTVTVDGMACPFCAYGLEKKLKGLEGVRQVKVELKTGMARLTLKEEAPPTVAAIREAVKKAGFTPKEIGITVVGRFQRDGKKLFLRSRGENRSFLLRQPAGNPVAKTGERRRASLPSRHSGGA
ncbi:MAG: heavy-metal-associated domain-containing protein [Planctomycetota bacterium]